jgi:hypothetical protein
MEGEGRKPADVNNPIAKGFFHADGFLRQPQERRGTESPALPCLLRVEAEADLTAYAPG